MASPPDDKIRTAEGAEPTKNTNDRNHNHINNRLCHTAFELYRHRGFSRLCIPQRPRPMKYQYHITNGRRQPYIGPRKSQTGKHVATALTVMAGAFAVSWAVAWIAIELKKLS